MNNWECMTQKHTNNQMPKKPSDFWSKIWQPKKDNEKAGGGARGVMVIVVGNGHGYTSSNSGQDIAFSHSTNTLGKGLNPIILPPAMGKQ